MKQLIFGGARSGKSSLAESITQSYGERIAYIATADKKFHDDEMRARVEHHRQQRPDHWQTIEQPLQLGQCLLDNGPDYNSSDYNRFKYDAIMVDCLTLWLTNCLMQEEKQPDFWKHEKQALLDALETIEVPVIMVSNEVGMGIVPLGELNRRFVDEAGFLNQAVAQICDRVVFTAAGLPMVLKGPAVDPA